MRKVTKKKFFLMMMASLMAVSIMLTGCATSKANAPVSSSVSTDESSSEEETESGRSSPSSSSSSSEESSSAESSEQKAEEAAEGKTEETKTVSAAGEMASAAESKSSQPRIIATSAATCDIMDRLGIDLIGVPETTVSSIAARYNGVTRVGSPMEPDMEIIKSLHPTDVIGPDTLQSDLKIKYDNAGVHSTFINLRSVKGLYDSVKLIGDKYGKTAEADAMMQEYKDFIASYSSGHEGEKKPKVLVLMGLPGSYLVATQNSYAGSLVELAGGENVFHDASKDFLTVNTEEILAKDPDVIIRTAHGLPKEAQAMFEKEFSTNDIWKHFRAVQEGKVYDVDYMIFGMSATFDYPQALADLEPMLYGD